MFIWVSIQDSGDDKYTKHGSDSDITGDTIYKLKGEICPITIVLKIVVPW